MTTRPLHHVSRWVFAVMTSLCPGCAGSRQSLSQLTRTDQWLSVDVAPSTVARLLAMITLGAGLVGCGSTPAGLLARTPTGTRAYAIDVRGGYFWTDSDGVTDAILFDEGHFNAKSLVNPGEPLRPGDESSLVHTVHVRVNWKQQARGVGEPDPTNATLSWLIQQRRGGKLLTLARYRGAGHARVDVVGRQASITLSDFSLRAVPGVPGKPDPLDRFQLRGSVVLDQNRAQVERLLGVLAAAETLAVGPEPPAGGPPARGMQP